MKALVTGATGQVGQALLATASPRAEVVPTTRASLDITDASAVTGFVRELAPDLIINAAAYTAVDAAEDEPELAHAVNASGAANLAAAAVECGARLVHVSTDYVFDGESTVPYSPNAAPAPLGVYGASKLAGERAVLEILAGRAIVLRTAWVYAPAGRNFLLTMLRLMRERDMVSVVSDQIGTPTTARSIAEAIWALAEQTDLSGIYHWTDAGIASWYDFAVAIAEEATARGLLDHPVQITPIRTQDYPTRARRPRFSVLDTQKTIEAIDITPAHWRTNLRRTLSEVQLG